MAETRLNKKIEMVRAVRDPQTKKQVLEKEIVERLGGSVQLAMSRTKRIESAKT